LVKTLIALVGSIAVACVVLPAAAGKPAVKPLKAHQEPRGVGHLLAQGDRVEIWYSVDTAGVKSPAGTLYVRNDLQRRFRSVAMKPAGQGTLRAVVPGRLLRGDRLVYFRKVRDPKSGRAATLPHRTAWILERPIVVRLGTHRFGHPRLPETVVARATPSEVGWQTEGDAFGPETFLVGRDRSIWLDDGLNNRLLRWSPDVPDVVAGSVPLPTGTTDGDVALGPDGSLYVTGGVGSGLLYHRVLYRLNASGQILWQSRLAGDLDDTGSFVLGANSPLRVGPDGTLYCLTGMPGLPGGEPGWMPVATPGGRPLSVSEQRRRTGWPYQPVARGLRLVSELHTPSDADAAPHEARFALFKGGRIVRAWRVLSRTDINFDYTTPELVSGDPVVLLDVTKGSGEGGSFKWEYEVLWLAPGGTRARFSLSRTVYGDNLLADVRVGPDGQLYQLGSSPATGVTISRYTVGPRSA
jgi:hypothetical protein